MNDLNRIEEALAEIRKVAEDKGYVLNEEIESIVGTELEPEGIIRLYDRLSEEKIEFFDSEEKAKLKLEARSRREQREAKRSEDMASASVRYDDPVRMYLREMGKVPLLDREGEIEIAKRIEAGNNKVCHSVYSLQSTTDRLREYLEFLEKEEMKLEDVVQVESGGLHSQLSGKKEQNRCLDALRKMIALRDETSDIKNSLRKRLSKKKTVELCKKLRSEEHTSELQSQQ